MRELGVGYWQVEMGVGGERCVLLEVVGYVSSRFQKAVQVFE